MLFLQGLNSLKLKYVCLKSVDFKHTYFKTTYSKPAYSGSTFFPFHRVINLSFVFIKLTLGLGIMMGITLLVPYSNVFAKELVVQKATPLYSIIQEEFTSPTSGPQKSLLGLYWFSQREVSNQSIEKNALMQMFDAGNNLSKFNNRQLQLKQVLGTLPVTGRVPLPQQDPNWLQANPAFNPVLETGDIVGLPDLEEKGLASVTVMQEDGTLCSVPYRVDVYAKHYVFACDIQDQYLSDHAWLIQADGKIHQVGLSLWNESSQVRPSIGSWIWAPGKRRLNRELLEILPFAAQSTYSEIISQKIARYLATLGPSNRAIFRQNLTKLTNIIDGPALIGQSQRYEPTNWPLSANDWGGIGLLQTPTTRMRESGSASFTVSNFSPYTQYNVSMQPFDNLEIVYRYSKVSNRLYNPDIAGGQSYTDKSVDAKFRILRETSYLPDIAIGIRDLVGTGLFSGEYVVANKRYGPLDFSLGLGFGYVGGRGDLKNPFGLLSSGFSTRPTTDVGQGGNPALSSYFHGPSALFGGVQYQTRVPQLTLKLELDGNNYQNEPQSNNQIQKSPINFGAVYQRQNSDFSLAIERGNTIMFGVSFHENFKRLSTPKLLEAKILPVPILPLVTAQLSNFDVLDRISVPRLSESSPNHLQTGSKTSDTSLDLPLGGIEKISAPLLDVVMVSKNYLSTLKDVEAISSWHPTQLNATEDTWIITLDPNDGAYLQDRIQKALSVLHRDAPLSITRFILRFQNQSLKVADYSVDRHIWMKKYNQLLPPSLAKQAEVLPFNFSSFENDSSINFKDSVKNLATYPPDRFSSGFDLAYQQLLGGPDAFVLFQLSAQLGAAAPLWKGAWLSGAGNLRLVDNFGKFKYDAPSNLPRVRTNVREYLTTSNFTIPNLQFTQVGQLGSNNFFSGYAGFLESMYAGVGGEWLYRPVGARFAVGLDINQVTQRDFRQDFNLREYQVNTGHLTSYWDTRWNDILVKTSVGQYLAGDKGFTLDLSRIFDNGLKIGGYFTKTNVSAEQFGEGSFDKGIYISLPFDAFFAKYSSASAGFLYQPLYRDGGAKMYRRYQLYEMTNQRGRNAMVFGPPSPN